MLSFLAALVACSPQPSMPVPKPWVNGAAPIGPYVHPKDVQAVPPAPTVAPNAQGARVLVIANISDPESVRLGKYYADKRGVPKANILLITTSTTEEIGQDVFKKDVEEPVKAALAKLPKVDFLLLARGVPIRIKEGGYSVDSMLMSSGLPLLTLPKGPGVTTYPYSDNPYFGKAEPFSHAKFGIYLACRLDGYTFEDAKALVDRSVAAKPNKGPFFLDSDPFKKGGGFGDMTDSLVKARDALRAKGYEVSWDESNVFVGTQEPLGGYASWGSNDTHFNLNLYRAFRFLPGALVETFVSTSGRTFRPTTGGQSLIADLIAQGATGVKGYVSEPYTVALARVDTLFGRYTAGANLAESFYAASPIVHWKDVVIGDPLCAPYGR